MTTPRAAMAAVLRGAVPSLGASSAALWPRPRWLEGHKAGFGSAAQSRGSLERAGSQHEGSVESPPCPLAGLFAYW